MATIKRVVTIAGALVLVILGGAVLYLSLADLSRFRPRLEALVSDVLGRELRIGGDFDLEVLPWPTLVATDVTFANASWGASEPMLSAGRLAVEVGLWSLVSGPIRIRKLELQRCRRVARTERRGRSELDAASGDAAARGGRAGRGSAGGNRGRIARQLRSPAAPAGSR